MYKITKPGKYKTRGFGIVELTELPEDHPDIP